MKRILSVILSTLIALAAVSSAAVPFSPFDTAIAAEASEDYNTALLPYEYYSLSGTEKANYLKLRTALINMDRSLEIHLTDHEIDKFMTLISLSDVLTCFIYKDMNWTYNTFTGVSVTLTFNYTMSRESYGVVLSEADKAADKIIKKFRDTTTEYEKIKYIHDYIISICEYDYSSYASDNIYGVFVNGKAKCDGYAHAFNYICTKAGIRAATVSGTCKGDHHAWNKVCSGGKWYNVDLTWDDSYENYKNYISYDYFMISDKTISATHKENKLSYCPMNAKDGSKSYYNVNKLTASSKSSAKKKLVSEIVKASKAGKNFVSIQLKDAELYAAVNNDEFICSVLSEADKQTKKPLVKNGYVYLSDGSFRNIYTIMFFTEGTKAKDYYKDPGELDSRTKKFLKSIGIK